MTNFERAVIEFCAGVILDEVARAGLDTEYTTPGPADAHDRANGYEPMDPDGDPLAGIPDDILAMAGVVR